MMKPSIKMPSPAMLVALLALFVALGGSAYAVNKVGTNQIKNNAVTTPKLKNNAVTTAKVANGAIKSAKLGEASVTGSKVAQQAIGGPNLADFSISADKLEGGSVTESKLAPGSVQGDRLSVVQVEGEEVIMSPGTSEIASANCPEGRQAIGYTWDNTIGVTYYLTRLVGNEVVMYALAPSGGEGTYNATATVICV